MRATRTPAYGRVKAVNRPPYSLDIERSRKEAIEDVEALMHHLHPRKVDSDERAVLKICGRLYR